MSEQDYLRGCRQGYISLLRICLLELTGSGDAAVAAMDANKRRRRLLAIRKQHGLTNPDFRELSGDTEASRCSIKTVERWFITPGLPSHRSVSAATLQLIELRLPAFLKAREGGKDE